jgi:hypothetical protein
MVCLDFSDSLLRFTAETHHSKSVVHAQRFTIVIPLPISLEDIGNRLSGPLATVEGLVIWWNIPGERGGGVQWRGFFNHLRQLKLLQVPWQEALDVAHSFQQDGSEPAMDLLPDLGQVDMEMTWYPPPRGPKRQDHVAIPHAFEPFIAAREKVGRTITLSLTSG